MWMIKWAILLTKWVSRLAIYLDRYFLCLSFHVRIKICSPPRRKKILLKSLFYTILLGQFLEMLSFFKNLSVTFAKNFLQLMDKDIPDWIVLLSWNDSTNARKSVVGRKARNQHQSITFSLTESWKNKIGTRKSGARNWSFLPAIIFCRKIRFLPYATFGTFYWIIEIILQRCGGFQHHVGT